MAYLVDGHLHLHPDYPLGRTLDAVLRHMRRHDPATTTGMVLLSEMAGVQRFHALPNAEGSWTFSDTGEEYTRIASNPEGHRIAIVAGSQIVTAEGLEVLAQGTTLRIPDGAALQPTLDAVLEGGGIAVLPWGVGKWTGARGRMIAGLAAGKPASPHLFLADSGVRPTLLPRPNVLAQAESQGWTVLAGTDPLPLSGEEAHAGRFGFVADHPFDAEHPFTALFAWLSGSSGSPDTYGALERPGRFVRNQVLMQIRKRLG
ncbi:MAG: hypothetical protein AAFQ51_15210 [Pseudomonadota bacterium]